jgi:hypothetical protein
MFVYCFKFVCQCNNIVLYLFQSPKVTALLLYLFQSPKVTAFFYICLNLQRLRRCFIFVSISKGYGVVLYLFQSPKATAYVPTVGRCSSTRRCATSTTCRRTDRSSLTSRSPKDSTKTRRLKIRILKLQKFNKPKKLVSKGLIKCFKTEIVKPNESNQFSQT